MFKVLVKSDLIPNGMEKRFPGDLSIKELKSKLVLVTGVEINDQKIELHIENQLIETLSDESKNLLDYIGEQNSEKKIVLNVLDVSNKSTQLFDDQEVQKYEISEEAYNKRENTFRNFKKQNKLGEFTKS